MSMLGDKLIPSACETDIAGAVSMYALTLASGRASDPLRTLLRVFLEHDGGGKKGFP